MQSKRQKAPSHGLMQQVNAAILVALPALSEENAKAFLGATEQKRREEAKTFVLAVVGKTSFKDETRSTNPDIESWISFYQRMFSLHLSAAGGEDMLNALNLPKAQHDLTRLVVVIPGITMNSVYHVCMQHFPCWRYADFEQNVSVNDRSTAKGPYAIRVRADIEADEQYKNQSADSINSLGVMSITLMERMLLELKHFDETGEHLDIRSATLCGGSRSKEGNVPSVRWLVNKFSVGLNEPFRQIPDFRVREISI